MSAATIPDRLRMLAGLSMLRREPLRQPEVQAEPEAEPVAPDTVADARDTLASFAARLREFSTARADMDAAVEAERGAGKLDFAGLVELGEPIPDLTALTGTRAAAEVRTRATKQLLDRLAEKAQRALHVLKVDALANVKAGRDRAADAVLAAIPEDIFAPEVIAGVVSQSRPVATAERALEAVSCCRWPLLAVPAELFGMKTRDTRTEPLAVNPGIAPLDKLDPLATAKLIDEALAVHLETVRFILDASSAPLSVEALRI